MRSGREDKEIPLLVEGNKRLTSSELAPQRVVLQSIQMINRNRTKETPATEAGGESATAGANLASLREINTKLQ